MHAKFGLGTLGNCAVRIFVYICLKRLLNEFAAGADCVAKGKQAHCRVRHTVAKKENGHFRG